MDTDGTQASSEPSDAFADPTAGLISVGRPEFTVRAKNTDGQQVTAPTPLKPDSEEFRELVDAQLRAEAARTEPAGDTDADDESEGGAAPSTAAGGMPASDAGPAGILPRQRRRLPARSQILPQVLRRQRVRRPAKVARPMEDTGPLEPVDPSPPADRVGRAAGADSDSGASDTGHGPGINVTSEPARPSGSRMSAGSVGVMLAVVLLLVFTTVAILFVAELLESITSLFS